MREWFGIKACREERESGDEDHHKRTEDHVCCDDCIFLRRARKTKNAIITVKVVFPNLKKNSESHRQRRSHKTPPGVPRV